MAVTTSNEIDQVLERFRRGQLTEDSLRQALENRLTAPRRQDLLYIECSSTAVNSSILGMNLVCNAEIVSPASRGEWAYANVLDAIRDGWRIIQFPEMALMMVEERNMGLGCEFVLEKWS